MDDVNMQYAFWHCPVVKRSGAIDILLISIVDCNNGVIFTPDIQTRCQNCWQAVMWPYKAVL